jgi:hypothetical protein
MAFILASWLIIYPTVAPYQSSAIQTIITILTIFAIFTPIAVLAIRAIIAILAVFTVHTISAFLAINTSVNLGKLTIFIMRYSPT